MLGMRRVMTAFELGLALTAVGFAATGWYIEAESVKPVSPWVLRDVKSGYSGSGYLEYTGKDTRSTTVGVLAYEFTVEKAGTYIVWLRGNSAAHCDDTRCIAGAPQSASDQRVSCLLLNGRPTIPSCRTRLRDKSLADLE